MKLDKQLVFIGWIMIMSTLCVRGFFFKKESDWMTPVKPANLETPFDGGTIPKTLTKFTVSYYTKQTAAVEVQSYNTAFTPTSKCEYFINTQVTFGEVSCYLINVKKPTFIYVKECDGFCDRMIISVRE